MKDEFEHDDEDDKYILREPDLSQTYTIGDYMRWAYEGAAELINGKIFMMLPSPTATHQMIVGNLYLEFAQFFKGNRCNVYLAPLDVYLARPTEDFKNGKNVLQPDLMVICDESKLKDYGCIGAPDLVLEIVSPSTKKRDLNVKYDLYEEFGVKEYWIVFPASKTANIYILQNGQLKLEHMIYEGGTASSVLFPDLQIDLKNIFPATKIPAK